MLPDHNRDDASWWWFDLAVHGVSAWEYFEVGAERLNYDESVQSAVETQSLSRAIREWRELDKVAQRVGDAWSGGRPRRRERC